MRTLTTLAVAILASAPCDGELARTTIAHPVATIAGEPIVLEGDGFGVPGEGRWLWLRTRTGILRIPSTAPEVELWEPTRVVVGLPLETRSGWIRIRGSRGLSNRVRLDVFAYDWFGIPRDGQFQSYPLDITVDATGLVWIHKEFHLAFNMLDPAIGIVRSLPIPKPPAPGPFADRRNDRRKQVSALGEKILVDPDGRVWFTQGGETLYSGPAPNHSRIVCFDPDAPEGESYRVYNVPGDKNEVIGLAWDSTDHRMWFTQAGFVAGAALVSFDPDAVPFDNHFDFSVPLDDLVCQPGEPEEGCYRYHWLPNPKSHPAHLLIDADGFVWYTNFWGNSVGRLDPATGMIEEYPLPERISLAWASQYVGSGPWDIDAAPNGDIVFNEYFDSTLSRFDVERLGDPACLDLDEDGRNPCIEELPVPGADLEHQNVHSIAYDPQANLWFTEGALVATDASLGFVTPDWQHVVRLPPLDHFPASEIASSAGIAIDPETGEIWFSEFFRGRIGHLRRLD